MMSYSYYGSKCSGYLFGTKSIFYYRCFYIVTIVVGAMITIEVVINVVDGMYAVMAPNSSWFGVVVRKSNGRS